MLGIIALLGIGGAAIAVGARGPLKKLGWPIAIISLGAGFLTLFMGPAVNLVALSAYGVALAAIPPFAHESHTARLRWFVSVLLAEVGLIFYFAAGEAEMIALWIMLFGPGALVAAARLVAQLRQYNEG